MKSGQVAVEQLTITIILFTLMFAIFMYYNPSISDTTRIEQTSEALRTIAATADRIGTMDTGTKMFVYITLPDGIVSTNVSENHVTVSLKTSAGETDIFETPNAKLTGNMPTGAGVYLVKLEVMNTSFVNITAVNSTG